MTALGFALAAVSGICFAAGVAVILHVGGE